MANETNPIGPIPGALVSETEVTIKEGHLDSFGHVNNAAYLQIFEQARWDLITPRGFGLKEVHQKMQGPTILDIHIQFKREVRNRETIKIKTFVTSHKGKISTLRQVMVNAKGEEACIADFVFGLFDTKQRKLIEATPEWIHALGLPEGF